MARVRDAMRKADKEDSESESMGRAQMARIRDAMRKVDEQEQMSQMARVRNAMRRADALHDHDSHYTRDIAAVQANNR